ncbi:MAG: ABC transporter substrate-binding protein [Anaerovoracaceae bacterium]|jgi:ABC-type nitrate/sulfonate/bicarbonate transport system substrate-binding protein|nr:ABC transporter substrate-binding protein [Anaerovoracaceae bacterium]
MRKILGIVLVVILLTASIALTACQQKPSSNTEITVLLDWIPNTNHTGLYAALEEGYFEEEGLAVNIIQPSEGGTADLIAAGQGEFGLSYQEQVTYARTAKTPLPVKAIAAVIQHNTSGFASPLDRGILTPKDFEGKKYGGWNSPMEEAMLKGLMAKNGADFSKLEMISVGTLDFFTAVSDHVDFTWIYYGWDGIAAEIKGLPLNFIRLQDVDVNLDSYTPVIIASEELLEEDPELAKAFLRATTKGYEFAIVNPDQAVEHLLKHAPEIDREIAIESQRYLAKEYKADGKRWGEMDINIWRNYGVFMWGQELIESELVAEEAFTNEYLPN